MSNLDGNKPGTKNITGDVNVQVAPTPNITVGNTTTLEPGQSATVELDSSSTALNPKFNFGIPKGEQGLQGIQGIPGVPGVDGYTPQKGKDYWTDAEKKEIVDETTEKVLTDATNKFNVNYESKVNEFNENADNKILEFNNNADEKTTSYNQNAETKLNEYNQNATNKTTEFNNNVNSIKDDIEDLKSNQIKGTATGTNINVQDSSNLKMASLVLDGKSTQETRSGKNLLLNNAESQTVNGITFTVNKDKSITLNGTNDNVGNSNLFIVTEIDNFTLQAGAYHTIATGQNGVNIAGYTGTKYVTFAGGSGNTFTLDEDTSFNSVYIQVGKGATTTFNNYKVYPIISTTPITVEEYEAFGVSPSPDYPSEIKTIENSLKITSCNKNILNKEIYELGKYIGNNGVITNNIQNFLFSNYERVKSNTEYTIGANAEMKNFVIAEYDKDKNWIKNTTKSVIKSSTFTTENNTLYVRVSCNYNYQEITKEIIDTLDIQLEKGTTFTPFEQHQENAIEFILPEPICSLPNGVKDEIYIKDGKAYLKKNIGKVVLNGSEEWSRYDTYNSINQLITTITNLPKYYGTSLPNENTLICSHFSSIGYSSYWVKNNSVLFASQNKLFIQTELSVEEFKSWLSENNVEVYYELAEPYEIDLGEVTMPKTYKNVSNIMNSKDTNMNVEYYKDLETVINNLTSAVVALGATE